LDELLSKWEEVYKKGLLSLWMLLLLNERPHYAYEAPAAIEELSQGTVRPEESSVYRALNRFEDVGVVRSKVRDSEIGPRRRYYSLTDKGLALLREFTRRNIGVFRTPRVRERLDAVLGERADRG
jgi:DNA-binding PadR family transcriptional regulator